MMRFKPMSDTVYGPFIDWDDAFANGPYIPGGADYPARWAAAAAAWRKTGRAELDLGYGTQARARYDLFLPDGAARGLVVFVHGGYWLKFDRSFWSHLAAGPVARGWAVAIPGYTLAPQARISDITAQIAQAVQVASARVAGPVVLAGHSAGGHLVTRMICADSPLPVRVLKRIARVVSISGLHDLRPLMATTMKVSLRLSAEEAAQESAALQAPVAGIPVTAWVGGLERPEFLRQSALLRETWVRRGSDVALVVEEGRHHFDVVEGLADADSALANALLAG